MVQPVVSEDLTARVTTLQQQILAESKPRKKGTPKDIQGPLRHSRLATTTDVYMREIPESVKATIEAINKEVRKPQETEGV